MRSLSFITVFRKCCTGNQIYLLIKDPLEIKAKMSSYLKVWQTKNVTTIETKIMADFSRRFLKYDLEVAERESQYAVDLL